MRTFLFCWLLTPTLFASAQFQILDTHTSADLRGVASVGNGVAWASGTHGTVLRTEDGGYLWQGCALPPGAEHLDFRGVQALDNNTALVLSSGAGDQSRLYETTDGCQSWRLIFTNPDPEGFWDALLLTPSPHMIYILGDPVQGHFQVFSSAIDAVTGKIQEFVPRSGTAASSAAPGQSAFAASNSLFAWMSGQAVPGFITGGSHSEFIRPSGASSGRPARTPLPFAACESCGAFAIAAASASAEQQAPALVVVGGNYQLPTAAAGTAAFSADGGRTFQPSAAPPHGYRSAVAFDATLKTWIAVGPNGSDLSQDGGRHWRALQPAAGEAPDADQHWNALSLPFAVGPHGRIGLLQESSLAGQSARRPAVLKP